MKIKYSGFALAYLVATLLLTACGGGGSSNATIDSTPPTVSSTSPANNATGFAVNAAITATFSENMDASTVSSASFTLNNGVTGSVTYSGTTVTFTPSSNLAYSTTYTATITTAIKDAAGNVMAANKTWMFSTGVAPDTTPPTVSSTSPANNATGFAVNAAITATFSENMDTSTVSSASFTLNNGVTGSVTYSGTTVTFTPSSNLAYSTTYTATITTAVKDAAGNAMAANKTWMFSTASLALTPTCENGGNDYPTCTPPIYKKVQFYVHPDFLQTQSLNEIQQNLSGYIDDLNVILGKNTRLRLTYDPNDVRTDQYSDIASCGDNPIDENFTYDVYIFKSTDAISHGGTVACDGFGLNRQVIKGLNWMKFYSRTEINDSTLASLQPGYDDYYTRQLTTLAHEIAHTMGAGFGEYYSLNMDDITGTLPDLKIYLYDTDNFYWKKRRNVEKDPLLANGSYPVGRAILDTAQYSSLTARIFNTTLDHKGLIDNFSYLINAWSKDYQPVDIQVIDDEIGAAIPNCLVSAYRQQAIDGIYLISEQITDSSGNAIVDIKRELDGTDGHRFILFKASCDSYLPTGDALSKFDLEAKYLNDGGQENDFQFTGTIVLRATKVK